MRAIVFTSPDSDPVVADFPDPEVRSGDEEFDLIGAGLHQVVRGLATGKHYGSAGEYPLIPGVDAVGRRADGSLVYTGWPHAPWGTMSERIATPFGIPLPEHSDPLAVAAGMNPGMSGWIPLATHRSERGSLGTVLILGATGMSGGMATRAALALGADRVVAAGRDRDTLAALRDAGAATVDLTDPAALARAIAEAAPDLVLDYVWGPVAESAFAALAGRGMEEDAADISYVQIGSLAGATAELPAALLRSRRIRITGSGAGSFSQEQLFAELPKLLAAIADGTVPVPYTAYPFDRIDEAWAHTGRTRAVVVPD